MFTLTSWYYNEALLMIQQLNSEMRTLSWQDALRDLITDGTALLAQLGLQAEQVGLSSQAAAQFACRVPRGFVAKMAPGDPLDPLLLQVLPSQQEMVALPGYTHDPLGEERANPIPGLLHKYHSRVLLTVAGSCAVNCRYCFRRHFPYQDNNPGTHGWEAALTYIQANPAIREVIFSGGDPLMLPDDRLLDLARRCVAIDHVTTLRIHTRLPIVIPQRLTDVLCQGLSDLPAKVVLVVHANHPNELDDETSAALKTLRAHGITALNQSVLLRGVNDRVDALAELSHRLFASDVLPYYLHVLDKVAGAAHFDMTRARVKALYADLQTQLSGYLVPKLVCEQAGALNKVLL